LELLVEVLDEVIPLSHRLQNLQLAGFGVILQLVRLFGLNAYLLMLDQLISNVLKVLI